ncbi:MAG: signal peptidase I [Lachnospiraceae bacterium]|nr:signal peptidase I [Lachnospiraceae bacterium]
MDDKDNYDGQFNNMYNGFNNGFNNPNNYYSEDDYTVPMDSNMAYQNSQWDVVSGANYDMNNYINNEYNYYDDNAGYMYDDRYEIDYSNSSSNYGGYDYGYGYDNNYGYNYDYNQYGPNGYNSAGEYNGNEYGNQGMAYDYNMNMSNMNGNSDNVSIEDISTKMDMNLDADMFFDGFETSGNGGFANNNNNYNVNNNSDSSGYNNYGGQGVNNSYGRINSNASYFNRSGTTDNKMIPTEDITFDDMYVVRNQLFEEEEKLFGFNDIISLVICVGFAIVMAFLINTYAGQITTVDGPSMEYNFHDREVLVLDKLTYRLKDPKRYDVVVFPVGSGTDFKYFIKRIIGLPGEKIYIDVEKSEIYADGKKLDDVYGWEKLSGYGKQVDTNNIVLGDDEYYCMGDNRNNSEDSRKTRVGPIKRDAFVGRAIFKISPIKSLGPIDHHYNDDIMSGKKKKPFVLDQ